MNLFVLFILTLFALPSTLYASDLEEVLLSYNHEVPYYQYLGEINLSECTFSFNSLPVFGSTISSTLSCKEYALLLRHKKIVDRWKKIQSRQGYINLTLHKFGVNHARAKIAYIREKKSNVYNASLKNSMVTGVFKRHVISVKEYIFENIETHHLTAINSTPDHRFYVINRHQFIPIKDISENDVLITSNNNRVKLTHSIATMKSTDKFYHAGAPVPVYNLEVYKKHTYFVGDSQVLVHNIKVQDSESQLKKVRIYHENNKLQYDGTVDENGQWSGEGIAYYENGNKAYEGYWLDGHFNGEGTLYCKTNSGKVYREYSGNWINGIRSGQGTEYGRRGYPIYSGSWLKDDFHGHGIRHTHNSNEIYREGRWSYGSPAFPDGILYPFREISKLPRKRTIIQSKPAQTHLQLPPYPRRLCDTSPVRERYFTLFD